MADQRDVLIHLRQPAAHGADGPLQRGVAADERLLMGEVPDPVPQFCRLTYRRRACGANRSSMPPQCKPPPLSSGLAVSASSVASAPSSRITSVCPDRMPSSRTESMCSGSSMTTPRGTYRKWPPDQTAACNAAKLSYLGSTGASEKMLPYQVAVPVYQLVEAAEEDALRRPFRGQLTGLRAAVDGDRLTGEFDARIQQGVAGHRRGGLVHRQNVLVQPKQPNVRAHPLFVAGRGPRQALEHLPCGTPLLHQPHRLPTRLHERVEGFLGEPAESSST